MLRFSLFWRIRREIADTWATQAGKLSGKHSGDKGLALGPVDFRQERDTKYRQSAAIRRSPQGGYLWILT
jgi:hypothetical protein